MAVHRWYGTYMTINTPVGIDELGQTQEFFLSTAADIDPLDKIVRWLIRWTLETPLIDNSSGLGKGVRPFQVFVAYTPNPDGQPLSVGGGPAGDVIYRDTTRWVGEPWTDGSLYATRWRATSGQVISIGGSRLVHNLDTATIHMSVVRMDEDMALEASQWQDIDVRGVLEVDFLIEKNS